MKVIFDTDGTLTDFNQFIKDNAIDYFKNEYGMEVVYPNKLEVEDIFDMDNFFKDKYNCSLKEAKKHTKEALDKFWVNLPRFIKFSILDKFRDGASDFINELKRNGHEIQIHTSRSKTTEKNIVGEISRKFTKLQYLFNKVNLKNDAFHFYKNDEEKIKGIIASKPDLVFEDKPEIIKVLNENGIKTICINGDHNTILEENTNVKKINTYDKEELENKINELLGKNGYEMLNRISKSDIIYNKIKIVIPYILSKFKPIVLHSENILKTNLEGVVVAPNHMSTLDPLILTSLIDENIHWAALKRFFDGKDSIFNNSKNPLLCKITSKGFKSLEYFPIERLRDNPNANNISSLKDMQTFLKYKQYVGIFPEGTTNKTPGRDFGDFDPAFISLAKKNDAWIQPITILWIKDLELDNKVIINFAKPFKVTNLTKEEAYQKYLNIQKESLEENKEYKKKLNDIKKLKKV
ncbi:MAG: 1-acyl-sn-glycerol-3-phosphate acyltransferase [Bacilli bacterium]|nr:1-acyl-sn-glycerol-3-phosphate acyltransferase [Bacilli bacterium]